MTDIYQFISEHFINMEIICVNDASDDNTVKQIHSFAEIYPDCTLSIVHLDHYHGKDYAFSAGVDIAIGDFVFEIDSTFIDYCPGLLLDLYAKALQGFDIVAARPKYTNDFTAKLFYSLFNRFSRINYQLAPETSRVISRRAINRLALLNNTIIYRKAHYSMCGLKIASIVYENKVGKYKKSMATFVKRQNVAINSFLYFTDIAYKFSSGLLLTMVLSVLICGVYAIINKQNYVESTIQTILISFGFVGVFLMLTIIIKYVDLILNILFKKQNYLISSIEKIN
jgi:dolichol-phosphate mannosyltransferase